MKVDSQTMAPFTNYYAKCLATKIIAGLEPHVNGKGRAWMMDQLFFMIANHMGDLVCETLIEVAQAREYLPKDSPEEGG